MNGSDLPAQRGRMPGERADLPEAVLVERLAVDLDATGMTVIPLASDTIESGQIVDLPEWKASCRPPYRWAAGATCRAEAGGGTR